MMITKLRYGNTNTFFIKGEHGGLLVDTDYAGTASKFCIALKDCGVKLSDIDHVCATHYHPKKILYGHANEQILPVTDIPARCTIDYEKYTNTD